MSGEYALAMDSKDNQALSVPSKEAPLLPEAGNEQGGLEKLEKVEHSREPSLNSCCSSFEREAMDEAEMDDTALFAENVRKEVSRASGIPTSDYSVEDVILMREARKLKMPFASGMVVYTRAHKDLSLKVDEMKRWLRRFAAIDRDKDGFILAEDLARYLRNQEKKLSFKNYLYGVVELSRPLLQNEGFLQSVFGFFDQDGDGKVTQQDLSLRLPIYGLPQQSEKRQRGEDNVIPTEMNYEDFKAMLETNPEYLVLFHECQNAGVSSPSPGTNGHVALDVDH